MNSHFPQWTSELVSRNVIGEDQLGVEGAAQSYQQYLVPGIITVTDRARYYSYYAWVLYRYITDPHSTRLLREFRGDYFKHHEVALILAAYSHHKDRGVIGGLVGSGNNNYKAKTYWDSDDPIPLDQDYFQNKLGGFGQYYFTSMQVMGLVSENDDNPAWAYKLTNRGEALAKAYEDSIRQTAYFQNESQKWDLRFLSRADAEEYGQVGCICSDALGSGSDRALLREAFFRFDQRGEDNPHFRRRLTLTVALDLVHAAGSKFTLDMLRPALYMGEFYPDQAYLPANALDSWVQRWKLIEVRHLFTFGLQCLWAAFLLQLSKKDRLSFEEYLIWASDTLLPEIFDAPLNVAIDGLCDELGLEDWQLSYPLYQSACLQGSGKDEITLYKNAVVNYQNPEVLLKNGFLILLQFFLRFLPLAEENGLLWQEMADQERLPISAYIRSMQSQTKDANWKVGNWLNWIYREYILGQHEFIALEKLRYQGYNTLKFYFQDGIFSWPFATSNQYREPIRLAANRLNNCISMLIDLGLIETKEDGSLILSADGTEYYQRVLTELGNGN